MENLMIHTSTGIYVGEAFSTTDQARKKNHLFGVQIICFIFWLNTIYLIYDFNLLWAGFTPSR